MSWEASIRCGRLVLIVEDEPLIALDLHEVLRSAGASILAATNIKDALELIACAQICAAIVDIDLGGQDCSSVCASRTERSIPFMFYTGYSSAAALTTWPLAPTLSKPAVTGTMVDILGRLITSTG